MKFSQLKIWQILPPRLLGVLALKENFSHEDEINRLFTELEYFDDDTKKEDLSANAASIIDQSNSLINRHTLATESHYSTAVVAALKTVKMQVFLRLENSERIKAEYDSFIRATASTLNIVYQLDETAQKRFTSPLIETARCANKYLLPTVLIKEKSNLQEVAVPDILAAATFVSDPDHNLGEVRTIFHQLWKIDELQPLLLYSAYATLGYKCNSDYEATQSQPLQIVLVNDAITRKAIANYAGFCSGSNMIVVSTKETRRDDEIFNERVGPILIHELHHYFEETFHQSNRLLPYPNSTKSLFFSDPDTAIKNRLDKMVMEALSCTKKEEIEVPSFIGAGRVITTFQPAETFGALKTYSGVQENERIRHAEIVVRISEIISDLCGVKQYSSQEAFEKLKGFGLNECVEFFHEEQQQMLKSCATLQRFSGISFNHKNPPATTIADYLQYTPAPTSDALARDSLNQTNLELAMQQEKHQTVLQFCQEIFQETGKWKNVGSDIKLLRKTAFYLAKLSYGQDSNLSEEANNLFKSAQLLPYAFKRNQINNVFDDARLNNLDQNLLEKINAVSDIFSAIANKELPRFDKLGNELIIYLRRSKMEKSQLENVIDVVREKYDLLRNQTVNYFLPKHPLRKPLFFYSPEEFLEKFERAINSNEHDKKEFGQKLLSDRMSIISPNNDSVIELIAYNCHHNLSGKKWYEIFKNLARNYEIDTGKKSENNNQSLLDLLPIDLREDFTKSSKSPNTAVKVKDSQTKLVDNDCCIIS